MERLTKTFQEDGEKFVCLPECEVECVYGWAKENSGCRCDRFAKILNRLAAIEDILGDDYDLDRLKKIVQADREGKCVLLPCKHNDTVWFIKSAFSVACFPIEANYVSIRGIDCDGDVLYAAITAYNKIERRFKKSDIGKTVFLNLKEAEAALEKMKEGEQK